MENLIVDLNLMPLKRNAESLSKVSLSPDNSPISTIPMDDELYCDAGRMNEYLEKGKS